jgi:hypothetical protein
VSNAAGVSAAIESWLDAATFITKQSVCPITDSKATIRDHETKCRLRRAVSIPEGGQEASNDSRDPYEQSS